MEGPPLSHPIRRLVPSDVERVLAVQSVCRDAAQWSRADYENAAASERVAWVAEDEGGIAGFLVARPLVQETEILNLAVRPDARRRGVGTALLAEGINWSRSRKAERLLLEVRVSNVVALKFYERHGFRALGRRPRYYANPTEDAVLLDLLL